MEDMPEDALVDVQEVDEVGCWVDAAVQAKTLDADIGKQWEHLAPTHLPSTDSRYGRLEHRVTACVNRRILETLCSLLLDSISRHYAGIHASVCVEPMSLECARIGQPDYYSLNPRAIPM